MSLQLKLIQTLLPEVRLIEPKVFEDNRGFFFESYQKERFTEAGIPFDFVQDNHSRSQLGTCADFIIKSKKHRGSWYVLSMARYSM